MPVCEVYLSEKSMMNNTITFNQNNNSNIGDGSLNRVPIRRNNLFYGEADMNFDMKIGMEYLGQDTNMSVVLFRVDIENSNFDDVYNESGKHTIQFKTPVEITCLYEIKEAELKTYDKQKNLGAYKQYGQLEVYVYDSELQYKDVDIVAGDYIGVQTTEQDMMYWTVVNDGKVNVANTQTMYGTRPFWRKIICAPVDENEFNGK